MTGPITVSKASRAVATAPGLRELFTATQEKTTQSGCHLKHVSCIYKSVCLFTRCVALSTWPEAWESHERMGSPGQAFLISCGESPKPGKQTFAHFFTISTWGRRQLTWGRRQLPSPCWDCINFFLPAYCEKQPGIRYWYSSIQSKLKCRGVGRKCVLWFSHGAGLSRSSRFVLVRELLWTELPQRGRKELLQMTPVVNWASKS